MVRAWKEWVGKVSEHKLAKLEIKTVRELRNLERASLECEFRCYRVRLFELGRGIDENPVEPDRPTQSIIGRRHVSGRCFVTRN